MNSKIIFRGAAPYSLPETKSARAQPSDGNVELTLAVPVDGQDPYPQILNTVLLPNVARHLAEQLLAAANEIESTRSARPGFRFSRLQKAS